MNFWQLQNIKLISPCQQKKWLPDLRFKRRSHRPALPFGNMPYLYSGFLPCFTEADLYALLPDTVCINQVSESPRPTKATARNPNIIPLPGPADVSLRWSKHPATPMIPVSCLSPAMLVKSPVITNGCRRIFNKKYRCPPCVAASKMNNWDFIWKNPISKMISCPTLISIRNRYLI